MPSKRANRVTERDVSLAVSKVLATKDTGEAYVAELVQRLPDYLDLSTADREQSQTRPNEQMWEQQVRNITSHYKAARNFVKKGYLERIPNGLRITDTGRRFLKSIH